MKKELSITVKNSKIQVDSAVSLKDIASTLKDGVYVVTIEPELKAGDADYYRKRVYHGIDVIVDETGQAKKAVESEAKRDIISDMSSLPEVFHWINMDQVVENQPFSFTWLTPQGWKEFYNRLRFWAHDKCDCYV